MEKKITALFEVNVPKSAKTLAKFVGRDKYRPVFCGVMIDPAACTMVATDAKELQAYNVECAGEWTENTQYYISAKTMRAIAGKTATITMFGEIGEMECNGEVYTCENIGKYPEWQRIIPDTAKHGKITFDKVGLKELRKFVKSHIKCKHISIDIEGGASVAIVKAWNWDYKEPGEDTEMLERVEITLAKPSQHEIFMHYPPINLYDCTDGCNGVIWVSPNYPAVFEGNAKHTVCMFCPHNNFVNEIATTPTGTPRISTQADEPINVSAEAKEGRKEAENGKTQIQIETANKFFKREWGKHAEMLGGLAECDGNVLCFYWRSLKNIVGKVRSRTYRFYPDHYEVESNIYNIYGCFNVQSIAYNYDGSIYTPPQPPTTPPTEPNEPTAHPTPERTETTIAAIAEKATTTPTIKKNLQVGTCRKSRQVGAAARNYRIVQSAYHIAHVGKMVALTDTPSNTLRIVAYVPRKCSKANAPPIGSIQTNLY